MSEATLLKMEGICKAFGSNRVLTGINMEVHAGEVVALLGENGAGKSTLIKILGGIYRADAGKIYINGQEKNITSVVEATENGIQIIHQEIVLVSHRTVAENVFLGREPRTALGLVDVRRMRSETQKLIDSFGLNFKADTLIKNLSIGMQQLVEIIKAVGVSANIVVMDEPTSSLSEAEVQTLFGIIRQLKERKVGIIYISHRLEELFQITDHVLVMRDGKAVGNVATKEAQKETLINLMVGRELKKYYTRTDNEIRGVSLEVKNLSHESYFKDINFYARYGEIVGFAGLIGARRTELMKTVFGTMPKQGGEVYLDGKRVNIKRPSDAIRAGIVYVSENRREEGLILSNDVKFNMGITCLKNFIKLIGIDQPAWNGMVEDYREKFSIKFTSSRQLVAQLSGGNQQKIVLSKWLALKPKVIILDEPTRGIDVGSKAEIYKIINDLAAKGTSIIMVSSELPEIINMCNRLYVMHEGKITAELAQKDFSQEQIMGYATMEN